MAPEPAVTGSAAWPGFERLLNLYRSRMDGDLPDWQAFHPEPGESAPVELSGLRGPAVVLLAGPSVASDGWAAGTAVHLARHRAERKGRLFLADLGLLDPSLHRMVGVDIGEGITDSFLFGASIQRIARPLEGGLLFASAGTPVADPGPVLSSPLWGRLIDGFDRAGAELFLYVAWNVPGRDALLERARNVLLLGRPEDADAFALPAGAGLRVGGFIGPTEDAGGEAAGDVGSGDIGPGDAVPGDVGAGEAAPGEAAPGDAAPGDVGAGEIDAPPAAVETRPATDQAAPPVETPVETPVGERGYPPTRPELPRDLSPEDFESLFGAAGREGTTASPSTPAASQATSEGSEPGGAASAETEGEDALHRIEQVNRRTSRLMILAGVFVVLVAVAVVLWLTGHLEIPGLGALPDGAHLPGRTPA